MKSLWLILFFIDEFFRLEMLYAKNTQAPVMAWTAVIPT